MKEVWGILLKEYRDGKGIGIHVSSVTWDADERQEHLIREIC